MFRFFAARIALVLPTFIGITLLTFAMIRLVPGDPIELLVGERGMSAQRHAALRAQFGYDRPLLEQYWVYLKDALQGDLGVSIATKQPVTTEFFTLFPATVELGLCGIVFAVVLGIPAGVIAAVRRGTMFDHTIMAVALTGFSMPIFWWGLLLIILFSGTLGWTPVSGRLSLMFYFEPVTGFMLIDSLLSGEKGAFTSALRHLILPTIALGTIPLAVIARQTRSAMLEVLSEDYVRTARAKGLSPLRVVGLHGLRNALVPVVTVIGLQVGVVFSGAVLTETIFAWPGVGKWLIASISRRDYPAVQGGILLIACVVILVNLTVDLIYGLLNPRIRHTR
ncbi:MAG: ABC transporter permease subunit [Gammaproteobacteria bacterium]